MAPGPTDRLAVPGPLLGREAELARLDGALTASLEGDGRLVLIAGEAGIGKTRLAEELARVARGRGALVLWGTGVEDDGAPPYWPWVQVLRRCAELPSGPLPRTGPGATDLSDLLPEAFQAALAGPGVADARGLRFRLFDSVTSLLGELARAQPLVVVLDDLHWADTPSLLLLEFLSRELHGRRLLVLACHRSPDLPAGAPLADHLIELTHLGVGISLTGLDETASRRLVEHTAGTAVAEGVTALVRDRTSGNPFFIRELVRLLAAQGRFSAGAGGGLPEFPGLPGTVRDLIDRRITRLSSGCATMLAQASVLGSDIDLELLPAVVGSPLAELLELLEEAEQAGVLVADSGAVTRYHFAHPLLREVPYRDLPASARAALHHRVGEIIETKRDDTSERASALAHHFYLGSRVCGPEKALQYAGVAGRQALSMLAYEEAAEHFEHALELHARLDGRASEHTELLLKLGDARMRAGDWPASTDACQRAAASARRRGDTEQLARAALGLGAGLTGFEIPLEDPGQLSLLEEARSALRGDSSLRARVLARLSVASTLTRPAQERAELSREAIAIARRVGDREALAYALSSYCDAIAGAQHTEERLELATEMVELARRSGSRETELLGRRFRLVALLELGDIAGVDAEIRAFAPIADALRQPLYRWYVPLWKGMRALTEGRLDDCEALIEQARAIGARAHSRNAEILTGMLWLSCLMERGRAGESCRLLEDVSDGRESGLNTSLFLVRLLADAGRRAEARSLLSRMSGDGFAHVVTEDTAALNGLAWAAEAAAELGHTEAAALLYERLSPYARRFGVSGIAVGTYGSISAALGRLAHLLRQWDAADAHFQDALDDHRRAGATLLVAHTLRHHASMLLDRHRLADGRGEHHAAEASLQEALAIYGELGLEWRVAQAERLRPDAAGAPAAGGAAVPNTFWCDGDVWTLAYGGTEVRVKDRKGFHDLARLLAQPGSEVHVLDLMAVAPGARPHLPLVEGLHEQGHAGELIDERARRQYRRRLAELDEELEDAERLGDPERAARAAAEREALVAELAAAYGMSGRARHAGDPVERARAAATWRIRSAVKQIQRAHPALGHHLAHSVRTGTFCSYAPEDPPVWASVGAGSGREPPKTPSAL